MAEFVLHDWQEVNYYMRDDYRLLVAGMALKQLASADAELQTMARTTFNALPAQGARSFSKAHPIEQRKAIAKGMQNLPQIAALVMALWAAAAQEPIHLLKQAAQMAGLEFNDAFDWRQGMEGFFTFEDIPLLSGLADGLGEKTTPQAYDHLKLAALWLGPAVVNRDALAGPTEQ
ncbi:MAG: hypothetical protein HDKAJFGB_02789 [Anaerolineae bacterium]|nr:hypothetical protein [Anaerolineae bacterium]RIK34252.1 MAG: hypothetical protein DCC52_01170 [Chloroflexota bacterium]